MYPQGWEGLIQKGSGAPIVVRDNDWIISFREPALAVMWAMMGRNNYDSRMENTFFTYTYSASTCKEE